MILSGFEWIFSGYEVPKGCCEDGIEASPKSVLFEQRALSPQSPPVPSTLPGTPVPVPAQLGRTGGSPPGPDWDSLWLWLGEIKMRKCSKRESKDK